MVGKKLVSFHIDIDSPKKLLKFYGIKDIKYSDDDLDYFYTVAMNRALKVLERNNIYATFFCVGDELESSVPAQEMIKMAFSAGHEIANHTYSHVYGLTRLDQKEIISEIEKCARVIENVTGIRPVGFRSPGYDINNTIIEILENLGYKYDASGFWSMLNLAAKACLRIKSKDKNIYSGFVLGLDTLPVSAYFPSQDNWLKRVSYRKIAELPLPRTRIFNMPFYNNFNLMLPPLYARFAVNLMNQDYFVYLFHLIEFVDCNDKIPPELHIHPNIRTRLDKKLNFIDGIIKDIVNRYSAIKTNEFIKTYCENQKNNIN